MRRVLLAAIALGPLALFAACATADAEKPFQDVADADSVLVDAAASTDADAELDASVPPGDAHVIVDAAPPTCSDGGLCWTEIPGSESLRGVWGDGQGTVWTASVEGHVFSWDGTAWTQRFTAPGALHSIWGSGPNDIWVGGVDGLFHGVGTTAATLSWTAVADLPGNQAIPIKSIWGRNANDVWAVGGSDDFSPEGLMGISRVLHLTKNGDGGGATWSLDEAASGAFFATSGRGFQVRRVWGTTSGDVWLGGKAFGGDTLEFYDSAAAVLRRGPTDTDWTEASPERNDRGGSLHDYDRYQEVHSGTSIGQTTWLAMSHIEGNIFNSSSTFNLAFGDGGISNDGGVGDAAAGDAGFPTWTESPLPAWAPVALTESLPASALWASSPNDIWYASRYLAMHFDGARWNTVNISLSSVPVDRVYWDIWGSGPNDVWIVGDGVAVHKSGAQP